MKIAITYCLFLLSVNIVFAQWQQTSLDSCTTFNILTDGTNIYACTNSSIFRSFDNGNSWVQVDNNRPPSTINSVFTRNSIVYIATSCGIYASADNGDTWNEKNNGLPVCSKAFSFAFNDTLLFISTIDSGIYYSKDNADTWVSFDNNDNSFARNMLVYDSSLYSCSYGFGIGKTKFDSINWRYYNSIGYALDYSRIVFENDSFVFVGTNNSGIFRYNGNTDQWDSICNGLPQYSRITSSVSFGSTIFIGVYDLIEFDGYVFVSFDNGDSWDDISDGLPKTVINSLVIHNNEIYAATSTVGVWKRPLSEINSINLTQQSSNINVFPNPANEVINISGLNDTALVEILNIQGKCVFIKALSINSSIDVSGLAQGVYVVRMKTENGVMTNKFVKQ